ncbi:serine/threonine-protein kinase HipA [Roseateles asaccharophilus]|uniref:type II toxin-antitoxin system HipA family toxin n=1 Tax=Roseateles asaccharophilus TaxID=582607 RepID=UPI003832725E
MNVNPFDEPLYLADFNLEPNRAYYGVKSQQLERIAPGVFVSKRLTPEDRRAVIERNAARITARVVEGAILAGACAFHRAPVAGVMLVTTPWGGAPINVGGVFTIYRTRSALDVSLNREVEHVEIKDDFGEYTVKRLADEMLILKNFQPLRGRPPAADLNIPDLSQVVERALRQFDGDKDALMRRLEALARHHSLTGQLKPAAAFITGLSSYSEVPKPMTSLDVYWHKSQIATLTNDGHIWSFDYAAGSKIQLSLSERVGKRSVPAFMASLLPETGARANGNLAEQLEAFREAHRYISNITVHESNAGRPTIILDQLEGELADFRTQFLEFGGRLDSSLTKTAHDDEFLVRMMRDSNMPRISGMQVKLPTNLNLQGDLSLAIDKSFTHIMKVSAGANHYSTLGSMEWFSLTVAKFCSLNVEEFALVDLGDRGPGLLVERFDVRRDFNDHRHILAEDFWSIAGMQDPKQKYNGELLDVADVILAHSTDPQTDGRRLLAQAMFSWLTYNSDMHLKNLMMLKECSDPKEGFTSIRLSPIYDVLCTQVYPSDPLSSAISLCGSRNHTLASFRKLGKRFGIEVDEVDSMADFLTVSIPLWADRVAAKLPAAIKKHSLSVEHIERARELFRVRCMMLLSELESARKIRPGGEATPEEMGSFSAEDFEPNEVNAHIAAEQKRSHLSSTSLKEGGPSARRPGP